MRLLVKYCVVVFSWFEYFWYRCLTAPKFGSRSAFDYQFIGAHGCRIYGPLDLRFRDAPRGTSDYLRPSEKSAAHYQALYLQYLATYR